MQPDPLAVARRPAELVLVAVPNGSGKSSVADIYIEARFPLWPKLNADRVLLALERMDALGADDQIDQR